MSGALVPTWMWIVLWSLLAAFVGVTAASGVTILRRRPPRRDALALACWRGQLLALHLEGGLDPEATARRRLRKVLGRRDPDLHDLWHLRIVPVNGRRPADPTARRRLALPPHPSRSLLRTLLTPIETLTGANAAAPYALLSLCCGHPVATGVNAPGPITAERKAAGSLISRAALHPPVEHWSLHRLPEPPRRWKEGLEAGLIGERAGMA